MELALEHVTRVFDDRLALDEVSFTVRPGRMTGFVGANGAGKTTAMRIVMGVLAPHLGGRHVRWRAADPPGASDVRLHAGGARPVPADAGARPAGPPRPGARHAPVGRRAACRRSCSTSSACRTGRTTCCRPCRWATSSACRWPPRCCTTLCSWCSTSPSPAWTRSRSTRWARCCARVPRPAFPCCSPPTSSGWSSSCATTSSSSTTAGWSPPAPPTRCGRAGVAGATGCGSSTTVAPVAELVAAVPGTTLLEQHGDTVVLDGPDGRRPGAARCRAGARMLREFGPVRPSLAEIFREVIR